MTYCVGNCLDFDEVSGLLTIQQDPLGGLECLPGGQRIRIAGNTRGIAPNNINNGLFMTSAGELATKVTPQVRYYSEVGAGQEINGNITNAGTNTYAFTSTLTITNPSAVYPMTVALSAAYFADFSIFPNTNAPASMEVYGVFFLNGFSTIYGFHKTSVDKINAASGGRTNFTRMQSGSETIYRSVSPGGTLTASAYTDMRGTGAGGGEAWAWSAQSKLSAVGFISERI